MSLKAAIQKGVAAAMDAVGDVATTVVYYNRDPTKSAKTQYVLNTGQVQVQWDIVTSVRGVLVKNTRSRLLNDAEINVKPGQQYFLVESAVLNLQPYIGDELEAQGKRWSVENIQLDPSGNLWIFQLVNASAPPVTSESQTRRITG